MFFEKSKHDALLKALAKRGHHLSKPDYRELDAEARLMRRSDDNWLPVTSSKHNTVLEWNELAKVLADARIFTGRVVSIGSRTPVDVFDERMFPLIVAHEQTHVLDISTNEHFRHGVIPLATLRPNLAPRSSRPHFVQMNMFGELGNGDNGAPTDASGSLYVYRFKTEPDGAHTSVGQLCVYPAMLHVIKVFILLDFF